MFPAANMYPQEGDGGAMEFTFFCFDIQLEDLSDMEIMFLSRVGKHGDVIKVEEYEPVQHVLENVVYQGLEHSRSVGQARWHHQVFAVPASCVKCGLQLIPFPGRYQMVGIPEVQLGADGILCINVM